MVRVDGELLWGMDEWLWVSVGHVDGTHWFRYCV